MLHVRLRLAKADRAVCRLKGYWVYIFNAIQNIGRTSQIKVCVTGQE